MYYSSVGNGDFTFTSNEKKTTLNDGATSSKKSLFKSKKLLGGVALGLGASFIFSHLFNHQG